MFFFKQSNYEYSNSITKTKIPISQEAIDLARGLLNVLEYEERQNLSQQLLDELCDLAGVDIVDLNLLDANQLHHKRNGKIVMKRYGSYKVSQKTISIHHRTASRGQILAPKSYLDTLLHEWLHHYDFQKLKIHSIHSRGFYMRLNDLKSKLQIPIDKKST